MFFRALGSSILKVIFLLGGIFAVWLLLFALYLYQTQKNYVLPSADNQGIIILTGGKNRIEEGLKLKDQLNIPAVFISGVHEKVALKNLALDKRDCCIELGHSAYNTKENAYESWVWIREKGYAKVILVTSDYHLPRAMDVFHKVIRDVEITPYPVKYIKATSLEEAIEFFKDWKTLKTIIHEYHKFLFQKITGLMEFKYE